jgi:hypothetical protein
MINIPVVKGHIRICNEKTKKCAKFKASVGLDTGASVSFISSKSMNYLSEKLGGFASANNTVASTPGGPVQIQEASGISLCMLVKKQKLCTSNVSVVPAEVITDVMIGSDLLRKHKCKIDMGKRRLTCEGKSIRFK